MQVVVEYPWGGPIEYPEIVLKTLQMLAKIIDIGVSNDTRSFEVHLYDYELRVVGLKDDDSPDWASIDPVWVIQDRRTKTELARYRNSNELRFCINGLKPYIKVLEIRKTYAFRHNTCKGRLYNLEVKLNTCVDNLESLTSKLEVAERGAKKVGTLRQRIGNKKRKITSLKAKIEKAEGNLKNSISPTKICDKALAELVASPLKKWEKIASDLGANFTKKTDKFEGVEVIQRGE